MECQLILNHAKARKKNEKMLSSLHHHNLHFRGRGEADTKEAAERTEVRVVHFPLLYWTLKIYRPVSFYKNDILLHFLTGLRSFVQTPFICKISVCSYTAHDHVFLQVEERRMSHQYLSSRGPIQIFCENEIDASASVQKTFQGMNRK